MIWKPRHVSDDVLVLMVGGELSPRRARRARRHIGFVRAVPPAADRIRVHAGQPEERLSQRVRVSRFHTLAPRVPG